MTAADKKQSKIKAFTGLTPLSKLVRSVVKDKMPARTVLFEQLFDAWPDLVCGTEADKSMPDRLVFARNEQNNGQLYVWALTSAQATEMSFNQSILITRINAWFGSNVVGTLRVTAFPVAGMVPLPRPESVKRKVNQASLGKSQYLDKVTDGISNPVLKTALNELGHTLDSETKATNPNPEMIDA
jgi:hypothetical protein